MRRVHVRVLHRWAFYLGGDALLLVAGKAHAMARSVPRTPRTHASLDDHRAYP
jgi:hypothetical protein